MTGRWDPGELPANVHVGPGTSIESKSSFDRFFSRRDPALVIGSNCMVYTWVGFSTEPDALIGSDRKLDQSSSDAPRVGKKMGRKLSAAQV